jgi:type IV pilus assembly protein PilC
MPTYQYTAVDNLGQKLRGQVEAASESSLEALLRKQGHWLAEAREQRVASPTRGRRRGNCSVPRRVLIEFFLQTGLQLQTGIALVDALGFGLEHQMHLGFRAVQRDLLERVRAGGSFSEALSAHPRTFAPLVISLVRAGESSGRLAETCAEIRRNYEWLDRLMADMRQALLYPAFVLVATIIFFFLVFTFLIPRFAAELTEIKVKMPLLTRVFLDISAFMSAHGLAVGLGLVAVGAGVALAPRYSPVVARLFDRAKLALPVIGPIHHLMCLSRVAQNLATLYRSGIPLLQSLQLCKSLVGNKILEEAVAEVEQSVNAGRPMNESMKGNPVFSRLMVQMVAVGESTGSLGDSLQHVSDYYDELVPRQVKKFLSILEPMLIIMLIFMVGTVALAVFLPIATMLDAK